MAASKINITSSPETDIDSALTEMDFEDVPGGALPEMNYGLVSIAFPALRCSPSASWFCC